MAGLKTKLKGALEVMGYDPDDVKLEDAGEGKVAGYVVSTKFKGKTQAQRQELIWDGLRRKLSPKDLVKIVAILTMTPREIE